ncbi:MAG TPA: leucyl aminopeptidase [Gemmatimonadota bacterium]|nr:leucyl aminopeptidase [Gemmatimonadota bacterium]
MQLKAVKGDVTTIETPALLVNLYQGITKPGGATGAVDRALDGQIGDLIADGEITGKPGETTIVHTGGRLPARRVVVVGLGKKEACDLEAIRRAMGSATQRLLQHGITRFHTVLHGGAGLSDGADTRAIAQAIAEAALMAGFKDDRYKTVSEEEEPGKTEPREKKELAGLTVVDADGRKLPAIRRGLDRGEKLARAVNYTRQLGNTPPNEMTPERLGERAQELADEHELECEVLDREALEEKGMGAILGVGLGSTNGPRLIVLRYRGGGKTAPPSAIVGKAVTFDTGGISIKPSARMEDMKYDKMGGCAVLGILKAAALLKLRKNLIGIIPAAENMPSGTAYRPGDILRSYSGKTIEIINTDAEGRLILADALAYAAEQDPREIIDLATLTGACVVALADAASGVFGDEDMIARLVEVGKRTGDRAWPLPVTQEFSDKMKSEVADIKNSSGDAWGGASNAAAFLKFFVQGGIPWVHLDIAGTAWVNKPKPYHPFGATGVGVRLVTEYLASG